MGWVHDVRFTMRRLANRPTYALLTVLTLSLAVGGVASVFGIAKKLLLDPLPYPAEDRIGVFWFSLSWSQAEFTYIRPQVEGFASLAMWTPQDATLTARDGPARLIPGATVTAEIFDVLGVAPALGPGFRPGDDQQGREPVAVISHGLWSELGRDPGIIGERLELAGAQRTVVGVMPEGFWFPDPTVRVWIGQQLDPADQGGRWTLVGRLADGVRMDAMGGPLSHLTTALGERFDYPEQWDKTRDAAVTPIREFLIGPVRPAVVALLAAMAAILLIACVNVSALMLGQVDGRVGELAVRAALGAGRHRLLRQLGIEALLIGAFAGASGGLLARLAFDFLTDALPLGALAEAASVDWSLFAAAMGTALVASTLIALAACVPILRGGLRTPLTGLRTGGVSGRGGRVENAMVVTQVAMVLLLAAGTGLLIRSVANLRVIDPGVDPRGVAVIDVVFPVTTPPDERAPLIRSLLESVRGVPGVSSVAATQTLPMRAGGNNWGMLIEGRTDEGVTTTYFRITTPDYFETMGIRLRGGRLFHETDALRTEEGVVVVNQALVDLYFPGEDPIGQRVAFTTTRWDQIIGVVENVAEGTLAEGASPARYVLYEHVFGSGIQPGQSVVLGTEGRRDAATVLDAARQAMQSSVPHVAIQELTTMERIHSRAVGPVRDVLSLLALLSGLALVLGTVGVFGVVSHFVTRRRREWSIRIALGQTPERVVRQVVGRGAALVAGGVALGIAAFLATAHLLASFLYGVDTTDPYALMGATAVLVGTGLLAAWIPARRASRTDPAVVLRE